MGLIRTLGLQRIKFRSDAPGKVALSAHIRDTFNTPTDYPGKKGKEKMNFDQLSITDITPVISEALAVWPGDCPFDRQEGLSFEKGDNMALSSIHTTVHLGAHADAPNHYHPKGQGIAARKLHYYLGNCQVIEVAIERGKRIVPQHLSSQTIQAPRILLKTNSFPRPRQFNEDFNALSPELVDVLAEQGVILVGLDTPSVDPFSDQELLSHRAIYRHDMAILEGIVLTHVNPGLYQLIALPLPIQNGDASPVRAILLSPKTENGGPQ